MKRIVLAAALWLAAGPVLAVETISPGELKPGMKGYGLTVLSGYTIQRFEAEVIDVMPNALPSADMVLVRCSGMGLDQTKLIAGMSGSPVYFEGKLAGAIAYTWSFQNEPIAGVTPIKAMIEAATVKTAPPVTAAAGKESGLDPSFRPIGCPVLISGLAPSLLPEAKRLLEPFNLGPVSIGGGSISDPEAPAKIEPGSALGVQLINGDLNLAAVGTATLVEGSTVYAFGHGFFNGGPVALPLTLAKVHTVISNSMLSFKLASPVKEVGTMVGDFPLAVSGRLGQSARMIPMTIAINNTATGNKKTFKFGIVDHPQMTLNIMQLAMLQALSLTGAISDLTTVSLEMDLSLRGWPETIHYRDMFALSRGSFANEYLVPATIFLNNPYRKLEIDRIDFSLEVRPGWEVAEIRSVWASKAEALPGETVTVGVRLMRFQGPEFENLFEFKIPEGSREMVSLSIVGGEQMPLDVAPPESAFDIVNAFKKLPKPTWLVMQYQKPGAFLDYAGGRLRELPPSAQALISGPGNTAAKRQQDFEFKIADTPYIIKGAAALQLIVKPEAGRIKK